MPDQWLFKSETYDNCNCAVNCGCQFNLPSTYGYCQSAFVGNVVEGHFNDTPLAGLNWAGLYKWPGEIAEGNGQRQIVIDERADEAHLRSPLQPGWVDPRYMMALRSTEAVPAFRCASRPNTEATVGRGFEKRRRFAWDH